MPVPIPGFQIPRSRPVVDGPLGTPTRMIPLHRKKAMAQPKAQNIVVLGAQWGDEGKAKMVDVLTE